jgi:hypothetical protein
MPDGLASLKAMCCSERFEMTECTFQRNNVHPRTLHAQQIIESSVCVGIQR